MTTTLQRSTQRLPLLDYTVPRTFRVVRAVQAPPRPAPRPPAPDRGHYLPTVSDASVQCPKCKAIQTVSFIGDTMIRTRKFSQKDGKVYHDCGSISPCLLFRAVKATVVSFRK